MSAQRVHRRNYNNSGDAHELTFSCYRRLPMLTAERTRQWLAASLAEARREYQFDLWAYVIMPEHAHLIVHPHRAVYDIAEIRKAIKEPVGRKALAYLRRHAPDWIRHLTRQRGRRTEHLFWQSGGGYDRNITSAAVLERMIDYVHLNPVRRKLVAKARDWEWSSAAWFEQGRSTPIEVNPIPSAWLDMDER